MTTARDIIYDALSATVALGEAMTPSDEDAQLCLRRLNRLVDSWANDKLFAFHVKESSFTMTPGTATYSSSPLSNGRPANVDSVRVRLSGTDYPVELINNQQYGDIEDKTTAGTPDQCYIDADYPNWTMAFYPVPAAAYTCYVSGRYPITSAMTLDSVLSLPPGYERALVDNLTVDIGPSFGVQAAPAAVEAARSSLAALKRNNAVHRVMTINLQGTY